MNALQFGLALIGGVGAFLGAAWIIAQAIMKTATNPVYDVKFEHGNSRMAQLQDEMHALREKIDNVPSSVIRMLRDMNVIRVPGGG
jgi:hypothetical protein